MRRGHSLEHNSDFLLMRINTVHPTFLKVYNNLLIILKQFDTSRLYADHKIFVSHPHSLCLAVIDYLVVKGGALDWTCIREID